LRTFGTESVPNGAPSSGELHDFDRTGIVLRVGITGESGKADALHSGEQAGGSQGCRAVMRLLRVKSFIASDP